MKRFYLIINLILGIATALLLLGHVYFKPAPPDKALKRTPSVMASGSAATAPALVLKLPTATAIQEKNIFDPQRGKATGAGEKDNMAFSANRPQLDLIGICRIGETAGAIIVEKGAPHGGGAGDPGNVKKRYFKQGETVVGGYLLANIEAEKVTLKSGNEVMELKMNRDRSSAQAASANARAGIAPTVHSRQAGGIGAATPPGRAPTLPPRASRRFNQQQPFPNPGR